MPFNVRGPNARVTGISVWVSTLGQHTCNKLACIHKLKAVPSRPEDPVSDGGDTSRLREPLTRPTTSIVGGPGTRGVKVTGLLGGPSPAAFDAYATNVYFAPGLNLPAAKLNSTCNTRTHTALGSVRGEGPKGPSCPLCNSLPLCKPNTCYTAGASHLIARPRLTSSRDGNVGAAPHRDTNQAVARYGCNKSSSNNAKNQQKHTHLHRIAQPAQQYLAACQADSNRIGKSTATQGTQTSRSDV